MNQELFLRAQMLERDSSELEERLNLVNQEIVELQSFDINLGKIDDSEEKEILASLGKGIFMRSEIKDKNLFVNVGSNILVKKTPEEAKKVISEQIERLGQIAEEISKQILYINKELEEIVKKFEEK